MKYLIHKDGYIYYIDIFVELPGTIVHETSHLIMSIILLSKVKAFSIIPHRDGDNITYGYVEQIPKLKISNFFIGFAPSFLNLSLLYLFLIYFKIDINFSFIDYKSINIYNIITIYITGVILSSSILSKQDLKVAINGLFSISGIFLIFIIIYLWKFHIEKFYFIKDINITEHIVNLTTIMTNTMYLFITMILIIFIIKNLKKIYSF